MDLNQAILRRAAKSIWYRPNKVRTCFRGPYTGIHFQLTEALRETRLAVFYRAYEPEVTEMLEHIVHPGGTVFDIGAHIGVHTLYMCKLLSGTGRIFAFEPWAENLADLVYNLRCNEDISQVVTPVPVAIGSKTQLTSFEDGGSDGRHHVGDVARPCDRLLPMTTIDAFCAKSGAVPDVIKIDIEGQEIPALQGAKDVLERFRPRLLLEHHHLADELRGFLAPAGYEVDALGRRHLYAHSPESA